MFIVVVKWLSGHIDEVTLRLTFLLFFTTCVTRPVLFRYNAKELLKTHKNIVFLTWSFETALSRMRSSAQKRYGPDGLGSRTGRTDFGQPGPDRKGPKPNLGQTEQTPRPGPDRIYPKPTLGQTERTRDQTWPKLT